ncbi:MAG: hypothetical protein HKL91_07955 [Candidatus Eremiobacteraeota bacterium]|uniref:Uncharacterized protein n=1 Tax=mine drainage metagenome TaxID=410659 RepID=E6PIB4_9ZZZZ|nr:hypothetical protein [Candidatus Eremiobacteraeota bacterium]
MTEIEIRRQVACPYTRAKELLRDRLQPLADAGASLPQRLSLTFHDRELGKEVEMQFAVARDPMHFDEPWAISWQPEVGGLYPSFHGSLSIRASDTYESARLELHGSYEPPLGAIGKAFDNVLGKHIAEATGARFLDEIASTIEARHLAEEAVKSAGR